MNKKQNRQVLFREYLESNQVLGFRLDDLLVKLIYATILILFVVWMLPSERPFEYSNLTIGSIAPREIIAPFKFAIQKAEQELEAEREAAQAAVPPVFIKKANVQNTQNLKLRTFFSETEAFLSQHQPERTDPGDQQKVSLAFPAIADSFVQQCNLKYNLSLTYDHLLLLYQIRTEKRLRTLQENLEGALQKIYQIGVMDRTKADLVESEISIVENGVEESLPTDKVLGLNEAREEIISTIANQYPSDAPEHQILKILTDAFFAPNLIFDETTTSERKEQAIHDVPLTRGFVEQDERIIDSNEKVTEEIYQKLVSLSAALKERSATQRGYDQIKFIGGKFLFAILLLFVTVLYLYYFRRNIFKDNRLLGMITLIFVIQLTSVAVIQHLTSLPAIAIPFLIAPMLLAMLLDFGIAFICTVTLSLILGSVFSNSYGLTFMSLVVGSIAIFSVQKIRNRGQMFKAILFIGIAYFHSHLIFGTLHFDKVARILADFTYYLLPNAILVPTVIFLLIRLFERGFDVTTDLTLLELSDLNHPLLKKLSVKAPGSFHHSIVVANLAEAAAKEIRANALLTRVGSYFHDVGKMLKPEYFVENQMGGVNKHDSLSPRMSCLILVNHVKEGLKLAEKHNLPKAVKQFIPEHHGTSIMHFFYHKALEGNGEKEINESDFRYPGPKPQSRETAIVMLADTVEAATRALQDPTPQRIRGLVDNLVEKKMKEGQLNESDLTLKQIEMIKDAFIPILTGIHHLRIEYPGEADKDKKPVKGAPVSPTVKDAQKANKKTEETAKAPVNDGNKN